MVDGFFVVRFQSYLKHAEPLVLKEDFIVLWRCDYGHPVPDPIKLDGGKSVGLSAFMTSSPSLNETNGALERDSIRGLANTLHYLASLRKNPAESSTASFLSQVTSAIWSEPPGCRSVLEVQAHFLPSPKGEDP